MKRLTHHLFACLVAVFILQPFSSRAVTEAELPGHSLFLYIKQWATPFPGPGEYTIDFAATGHSYSIAATGAVTSASGTWSFRQGTIGGSVVITLQNYFGNGTGAEIVLLLDGHYELYAGNANQNGNWSLTRFMKDPMFFSEPIDVTAPEGGFATFTASLLNGSAGVQFQWFKDGSPLTNAIKSSLTLLGLEKGSEGAYSVQVWKGSDTNMSVAGHLKVVPSQTSVFEGRSFEMVVTNKSIVPGLPSTHPTNAFRFDSFSQVSWKEGAFTFLADYSGGGTNKGKRGFGLFTLTNGVFEKLILSSDSMPGGPDPYSSISGFSEPELGNFLFYGIARNSSGSANAAILQWNGSGATRLVGTGSDIPGGDGQNFRYFGIPYGSGLDAAFAGVGPGTYEGFYKFQNGQLVSLLDSSTILPGFSASPQIIGAVSGPNGKEAFRVFGVIERTSQAVGYFARNAAGVFEKLADNHTVYPGTTNAMTVLGTEPPKVGKNSTAFFMFDSSGNRYLLSFDATGLHGVAKAGDPLPGGSAKIVNVNRMEVTDSGVVFEAGTTEDKTGIYLSKNGVVTTVMDHLSRIGTNLVNVVSLRSASGTNLVLAVVLYPSGANGITVNSAAAGSQPPSAPRINPEKSGFDLQGHFSVSVSSTVGNLLILEQSPDLKSWVPISTNKPVSAQNMQTDPELRPGQNQNFYRVRETAP